VVNEDEELYAVVEETSHVSDISSQTHQRLYGRQQISFTVCCHIAVLLQCTTSVGLLFHRPILTLNIVNYRVQCSRTCQLVK